MNPSRGDSKEPFIPAQAGLFYNFLLTQDAADSFRRFGALRQPIQCPFRIDLNFRWVGDGVVLSQDLQETAISGSTFVDNDDPVIGTLFRPDPGQTHCYQTVSLLPR